MLVLGISCTAVHAQFQNDATFVTGLDGQQWDHSIAYNPERNEFLMTFYDYHSGQKRCISYLRLNAYGSIIGSEVTIPDDFTGTHRASVCYNSANDEYFIAYTGWHDNAQGQFLDSHIYAQRVNAITGALVGGTIIITTAVAAGEVEVVYSSVDNSYMVAWQKANPGNTDDIYSQRLTNLGQLSGSTQNLTSGIASLTANPQIAYNSTNDECMVLFQVDSSALVPPLWWDVYGQRLRCSDGAQLGGNFAVATTSRWDQNESICYDPDHNRYLAVYEGLGEPNGVWAQFITAAGVLDGSRVALEMNNLTGGVPNAAYMPSIDEFLVCWQSGVDNTNYARRITYAGQTLGDTFKINSWLEGNGNFKPFPVANTTTGEYLTTWYNSYDNIYNRRYLPSAVPLGPVTNFVATEGNGQNVLTWLNPGGQQFAGTLIRFKTTGYPTGPTDGTAIYDSTGTTYTHTGLTNGVTYYYTAWAHDSAPNYTTGVNVSATPTATPGLLIIPQPQELTWKAGTGFLVNVSTQIMANSSPDAKEQNMAEQLRRKVWDMTGYLPTIVYGGSTTSNVIAVGDPARCPAVNSIIATWSEASGKASKTQGYMLGIKDTSIVIRGFDGAGSFYGSQTLIQLLEYFKTTRVSPLFCYDYPDMPLRGGMWKFIANHDWAFTKELTSEMLTRYKLNAAWVRVDNGMQWDSHPELPLNVPENPVTESMYTDYFNFVDLHYMVKMPSSAGSYHNTNEWLTSGTLNTTYRENQGKADPDPKESFCPLHTGAQTLVYDLWNEVNAATNTPYFGAGHSEYNDLRWSGCTRCMAYASNAAVYNQFIWNDYNWCNARGKQQIIFGDMLRVEEPWGGSPSHWNTASAVSTIPDATIIQDWEYGSPGSVPTDYPTIDRWITNGLQVIGCPYGFGSYPAYNQYYGDKENIYYWATALNARKASYPSQIRGLLAFNKYTANDKQVITNDAFAKQLLGCFPYYAAWAWNVGDPNWNPYPYGNGWSVVEREISPDRVSGFTAAVNGANVNLTWTNPPESKFQATYIVYRTDRYPTSPIDGTYLSDITGSPSAAGNYTHVSAPVNGCYYAAFAHDNVRHFSADATARVGAAGFCFQEFFAYSNGALNGNGGWSGSATSAHIAIESQCVKIIGGSGSKDAIKTVSCGDPGTGYIIVTCRINGEAGDSTMWNLWIDDSSAKNFARWYGSGTTARGRIGTTGTVTATQTLTGGWDTLKVKINPTANTTQFFFNGNSLGTYDHGQTGVGNVIQRLRFERINNSGASGNYLYFDDLFIGEAAPDVTPPGPVTNFVATGGDTQVSLSWTNPTSDYSGTMIRFSTGGYPLDQNDGTLLYNGTGTSTTHTGLTNGVTYYYSAFAYDAVPNYSARASASAIPVDASAPNPPSGFTATAGDTQNGLSWTNPTPPDFAGTMLRFKTNGYPVGPTDGTQVYNGTGTSTTHTGLTNGVTYYYAAYAYDEVPNYSSAATASATPSAGFCFRDEFNYANGALSGNGGWSGSAGSSQIEVVSNFVRVWGGATSYDAIKTVSCSSSPTGYIWVRILAYLGSGWDTIWSVWIDDSSARNFGRWYGSGSTARGRIGGTANVTAVQNLQGNGVWDSLVMKINPAANTTQFYFNGADLGTLSHASEGTADVVGRVRFERMNNSAGSGQFVYLDDVRVGPY